VGSQGRFLLLGLTDAKTRQKEGSPGRLQSGAAYKEEAKRGQDDRFGRPEKEDRKINKLDLWCDSTTYYFGGIE
jgi:hypothetical protein